MLFIVNIEIKKWKTIGVSGGEVLIHLKKPNEQAGRFIKIQSIKSSSFISQLWIALW